MVYVQRGAADRHREGRSPARQHERGWHRPLLGLIAVFIGSGCSALLDMKNEQCQVDADCNAIFGPTAPFLCVNNVCERPTCGSYSDCRTHGDAFATAICDELSHQCIEAQCLESRQCGTGQVCNTARVDETINTCIGLECQTTQECIRDRGISPTVMCLNGLCIDETWGCIGQPDPRPRIASEPATLKIPVVDALTQKPPTDALTVKACPLALGDPECLTPIAGATAAYDAASGFITVEGLTPGADIRVKIDPPDATKTIPMDVLSFKPPVGVTQTPYVSYIPRAFLSSLTLGQGGSNTLINPQLGNLYGNILDCQDRPAENVKLTILDSPESGETTIILYFAGLVIRREGEPQQTTPTGTFSALNVKMNAIVRVNTSLVVTDQAGRVVERPINSYKLTALPERLTTVHFYARDYLKVEGE